MPEHGILSRNSEILLASLASGSIADIFCHPLDTVKSRQQARSDTHVSMWRTAKGIQQKFGLRGFFRGYGPVAVMGLICNPSYYGGYQIVHEYVDTHHPAYSFYGQLLGGAVAELMASFVSVPEAIIKKRQQVHDPNIHGAAAKQSSWSLTKEIYRTGGIRAFYGGYTAQMLTTVPFAMAFFVQYEVFKSQLAAYRNKPVEDLHSYSVFACSTLSATLAVAYTHPIDVITTRLQVQKFEAEGASPTNAPAAGQAQTMEGGKTAAAKEPLSRSTREVPKGPSYSTSASPVPTQPRNREQKVTALGKRRIHSAAHGVPESQQDNRYRGIMHTTSRILKEEGVTGFAKGFPVRCLWMVPWMAISNTAFQKTLVWMGSDQVELQ